MDKVKPFSLSDFIEKYRFIIGGALLLLILAGGGILIYRENYSKPDYETKIDELNNKITKLQETISNQTTITQPNIENTGGITQNDQGQIAGASNVAKQSSSSKTSQPVGKININTASASQLDSLPGIGQAYAGRIIDYRNANGGFKSIEEIKNVKGIGDKTFEKFRDQITI